MAISPPKRPSTLFKKYVARLIARLLLFAASVALLFVAPEQLDIAKSFGLQHGFTFTNLAFALMAFDLVSKLRPHAPIAMGSRKQYAEYHVPTPRMFAGGVRELHEHALALLEQAPELLQKALLDTHRAMQEVTQGMLEAGHQLVCTIDVLRILPWSEEDLAADERLRDSIRRQRVREIAPVIVFWIVFNAALGLALDRFGLLSATTVLVWSLFYFLFDMISVVLWCPLQLVLMRNRCCTTCQIFNWDGVMTVTPLLVVGCWFSGLLIVLALVVLIRWELAFARHPERFDERTNASLQCANCKDKLCYLRKPLTSPQRHNANI